MHRSPVHTKWQSPEAGRHYVGARWASARRAGRDPRLVATLLDACVEPTRELALLDAPCGTGRLCASLAMRGRYVGLDVSLPMLSEAVRASAASAWLHGDVTQLPFRDRAFDVVVCCRLLHHLAEAEQLERVLAELVRVSSRYLIASFWDRQSLPAWRRALLPSARPARRVARSRAELRAFVEHAGASVIAFEHSFRFVSRQTFFLARRRER